MCFILSNILQQFIQKWDIFALQLHVFWVYNSVLFLHLTHIKNLSHIQSLDINNLMLQRHVIPAFKHSKYNCPNMSVELPKIACLSTGRKACVKSHVWTEARWLGLVVLVHPLVHPL